MITYPNQAKELLALLQADQDEKREVGYAYFHESDKKLLDTMPASLRQHTKEHTTRMLQIVDEIGEHSLARIGTDAAQAVSVLALHDSLPVLKRILKAFDDLYKKDKSSVYFQAIPSMTDWVCILEHKPQKFGTQWQFDQNKQPYLPSVEDFEHVNERRQEYGIESLRWPKSLAIPESEQPWLKRPLSELVMREPTNEEYQEFSKDFLT
jgi:hypothetical protein